MSTVGPEALAPALASWVWLIGQDKLPVFLSLSGDVFLRDTGGTVFWLETGAGTVARVASSLEEFEELLAGPEQRNEWLLEKVIRDIRESGVEPTPGQCLGFRVIPVVGGTYDGENRVYMRGVDHVRFTGYFHEQIKDLPDGSRVRLEVVD